MRARSILFSGPMVRALLDGRKTQTRRVNRGGFCPFGGPGDLLWVRETWSVPHRYDHVGPSNIPTIDVRTHYAATENRGDLLWRPSIHMPRWASRLTLKVTDVRVQRVQDIDGLDAIAEGITRVEGEAPWRVFWSLWDSLHQGDDSFAANPLVWALTFEVLHANVDAVLENRETI